jgi:hypothetical protein
MGLLADQYGVIAGFYLLGGMALVTVVFIGFLRRWAFAATKLGAALAT